MRLRRIAIGAVLAAAVASACGESEVPTGPSAAAVPSPPKVSSVSVTSTTTNFNQRGQTHQLAAQATLSNGFVENRTQAATWQSDNTGVASVSSSGVMTLGNEGEATIAATLEGQRGTLRVRVHTPSGRRIRQPVSVCRNPTKPRSSCNSSTSVPISWPDRASPSPAGRGPGNTWSSSWIAFVSRTRAGGSTCVAE